MNSRRRWLQTVIANNTACKKVAKCSKGYPSPLSSYPLMKIYWKDVHTCNYIFHNRVHSLSALQFDRRNGSTRAIVIQDALQIANIVDLVSMMVRIWLKGEFTHQHTHTHACTFASYNKYTRACTIRHRNISRNSRHFASLKVFENENVRLSCDAATDNLIAEQIDYRKLSAEHVKNQPSFVRKPVRNRSNRWRWRHRFDESSPDFFVEFSRASSAVRCGTLGCGSLSSFAPHARVPRVVFLVTLLNDRRQQGRLHTRLIPYMYIYYVCILLKRRRPCSAFFFSFIFGCYELASSLPPDTLTTL